MERFKFRSCILLTYLLAVVGGQTSTHSWVKCSSLVFGYCPWVVCSAARDWHPQIPLQFLFCSSSGLCCLTANASYTLSFDMRLSCSLFSFIYCMTKACCMIWLIDTFYYMFYLNDCFMLLCHTAWYRHSYFSVSSFFLYYSLDLTEHPEVLVLYPLILNYFELPSPQPTTGAQPTEVPASQEVNIQSTTCIYFTWKKMTHV